MATTATDFGPFRRARRRASPAAGRAAGGLLLALVLLGLPRVAPAQRRPSPIDEIFALISVIEDQITRVESDVSDLQSSNLSQATGFLGLLSCLDSSARWDASIDLSLLPIVDADVHGGVDAFGSGAKGKVKARIEGAGSIDTTAGSGLGTTICVDWLKLAAFIESQASAARTAGDEAQRLAVSPIEQALSSSAVSDLDALLGDLPEPTRIAEDLLSLMGGFSGTLNPSGVLDGAVTTATAAFQVGPDLLAHPEDVFALSEALPLPSGVRDELRAIQDIPARFANVDLCSFPVVNQVLGEDCAGLNRGIDPDRLFAALGGIQGLPETLGGLEGSVGTLQVAAGQIDTAVGGVGVALAGIEGELDGIRAAVASLDGSVAGIEAAVAGVDSSLQPIQTAVGGMRSTLGTANGFALAVLVPTLDTIQGTLGRAQQAFVQVRDSLGAALGLVQNFRNSVEPALRSIEGLVSTLVGAADLAQFDLQFIGTAVEFINGAADTVLDLIDRLL